MGLATVTAERVREIANKVAAEAKLTAEEGKQLADDLTNDAIAAKERIEEQISLGVKSTINSLNMVTKSDLERLEKRIEELEKQNKS